MFNCEQCGCCCRHVDKSEIYSDLDRGDGVCKYLEGNLCSVYEYRPTRCRIDECYELYFAETMARQLYYKLNKVECEKLKKLEG